MYSYARVTFVGDMEKDVPTYFVGELGGKGREVELRGCEEIAVVVCGARWSFAVVYGALYC